MASCYTLRLQVAERQLASINDEMKSQATDSSAESIGESFQSAWEKSRKEECSSQVTMSGSWGGVEFERCEVRFTKRRIEELRPPHYCDVHPCPAKE
jgi:uncharacterized protein YecT (DUF1311 family)